MGANASMSCGRLRAFQKIAFKKEKRRKVYQPMKQAIYLSKCLQLSLVGKETR